jgi:hypothetical protein
VRAFGAFGIGLAVGALLGRTLPAFVLGAALTFVVLFATGQARETWLRSQPSTVIAEVSPDTGELAIVRGAVQTGWGVRVPDGTLISFKEARALVSAAGVPPADPDDLQDVPALLWLEEYGYTVVPLGLTEEIAMGWAPIDALLYGLVGVASLGGAVVLVNRLRPI